MYIGFAFVACRKAIRWSGRNFHIAEPDELLVIMGVRTKLLT